MREGRVILSLDPCVRRDDNGTVILVIVRGTFAYLSAVIPAYRQAGLA